MVALVVRVAVTGVVAGCSAASGGGPDGGDGAAHFDGLGADAGGSDGVNADGSTLDGPRDAGHGGFILQGTVSVVGAEPDTLTFEVANDLGQGVPVWVHMGAPDYRIEVPPLAGFDRLYTITFKVPGYAPVSMGRIYKPGFSGTPVTDTFNVELAAVTPGIVAGRTYAFGSNGKVRNGVGAAVIPATGTIVIAGEKNYRLIRGGLAGMTVTELPDAPLTDSSLDCSIPVTPDGRFAFLRERSSLAGTAGYAVIDLVAGRVAVRLPELGTSISHQGGLLDDQGLLIFSPRGDFAMTKVGTTFNSNALYIKFDGDSVTSIELPVETDGFTPDGRTFVATLNGTTTLSSYDRASGTMSSFGATPTRLAGPPLLTYDGSSMLVPEHGPDPSYQCWREAAGCTLTLVGPGGADSRTLPGPAYRYAVSTTRRALMYVMGGAVVYHDADTRQTVSTPVVYTDGLLGYAAQQRLGYGSIVTDDRLTVLGDAGAHVFDVATGNRLAMVPGAWTALRSFAGDVVGLEGTCDGQPCYALLDTRTAVATVMPANPSIPLGTGGFHANGARRWKKLLSFDGMSTLGVVAGNAADTGDRWLPISQGGDNDTSCGFRWPATYHAPCVLYRRPFLGLLAGKEDDDTLCAP